MKKIRYSIFSALIVFVALSFTFEFDSTNSIFKKLKNDFGYVPSGKVKLNDSELTVQAFYIAKTVVTNGEYKVFLDDLIATGQIEKYKLAKIDSTGWYTVPNNNFEKLGESYHLQTEYESYPVVNVTKEGATLYCEWYTAKMNEGIPKEEHLIFRLPQKAEWLRAAEGSEPNKIYTWNSLYLRNNQGKYLANFVSTPQSSITRNEAGDLEIVTNQVKYLSKINTMDVISPAKSYYPNEFDVYNMNGNVAELLADPNEVIGGSWYDPGFDIKNRSVKKYSGASATVGFRIVATAIN
ncbi:hypothetical protein CW751_08435 [Brumimicrobium salinarum]|uniref:Sulfatase-modifying factor enzyme-like domain-containing protein n=1 Tax=Brumimicrobium salinarum TaxID=2058658 RepID=A0A2I0R2J4_9FLAO|nr:SUMF1/EgtB/PvdO family nonheme iron enzyme [Brumimicrobium salinarum]PKR80787.1 hypothetical protein CW751_08435 [Brumimicrobium salinarum]